MAEGEGFKVKIGGDYKSEVKTGAVTALALGSNARADINAGGIQIEKTNVEINGKYDVHVNTGAVTALALGERVSARINLGGIQSLQ